MCRAIQCHIGDEFLPAVSMPHPELEEQRGKPLEGIYPATAK
jgi:hypothetical protein